MPEHPTGTVTFLFSDIESSTRLWEQDAELMKDALATHDRIMREAVGARGGYVFATGGDSFSVAFWRAQDAALAALGAQRSLSNQDWGSTAVRVRMAVHTGEAEERDGDYFGPALNRAARLMGIGHGGQVLLSQSAASLVDAADLTLTDLGRHGLKDLTQLRCRGCPMRCSGE